MEDPFDGLSRICPGPAETAHTMDDTGSWPCACSSPQARRKYMIQQGILAVALAALGSAGCVPQTAYSEPEAVPHVIVPTQRGAVPAGATFWATLDASVSARVQDLGAPFTA